MFTRETGRWGGSLAGRDKDVNEFLIGRGRGVPEWSQRPLWSRRPPGHGRRSCCRRVSDRSDKFSYGRLAMRSTSGSKTTAECLSDFARQAYLMYDRRLVEIGNNDDFNALMMEKTALSPGSFSPDGVAGHAQQLRLRGDGTRDSVDSMPAKQVSMSTCITERRRNVRVFAQRRGSRVPISRTLEPGMESCSDQQDEDAPVEFGSGRRAAGGGRIAQEPGARPLACEPENRLFLFRDPDPLLPRLHFRENRVEAVGHTGSGRRLRANPLVPALWRRSRSNRHGP